MEDLLHSSHAILVVTPSGKKISDLLPQLVITDSEIIEVPPEGKLQIKHVRGLIGQLATASIRPRRVIFIPDAERLLPAAANALLKTLEEAKPGNIFLLTSAYPGRLLPTVRSRCRIIRQHRTLAAHEEVIGVVPVFDPKRKEPLTDKETSSIGRNLLGQIRQAYNPNAHKSLLRLRDYYKAKAAGAGEKMASDALLASLVNLDTGRLSRRT